MCQVARERESVSSSRARNVPDAVADNEADHSTQSTTVDHNRAESRAEQHTVQQQSTHHNSNDGIQEARTL